jgi:hypothetical protein
VTEDKELAERWNAAWPAALEAWSRFTRLRPPLLCVAWDAAQAEGLTGSFAMIRLNDQSVVINLAYIKSAKLQDYAVEILAHEIGHHVYAPATLTDHGRMLARMRAALPTLENFAPQLANLYTDLLINDRLQRSANLRMAEVRAVRCGRYTCASTRSCGIFRAAVWVAARSTIAWRVTRGWARACCGATRATG